MSQFQLTASMPMTTGRGGEAADDAAGMTEEATLFARFLGGDDIAAIKVFKRYNNRLFTYCAKVVVDRDQAKDLTQEIWERIVRLRADPPQIHNPMGFLLRVARNLCLNHLRLRKEHVSLASVHESAHPTDGTRTFSDLEEMVLASLEDLSFEHREVLILNIYCGYRLDEIAEMFGKTPDAIWARASRARAQLRKRVSAMIGSSENNGTTSGRDTTRPNGE